MIVRVGTLSEVGKVEFADTDGLEAADVLAVIFVDPLDSEYELVSNDDVSELFDESSGIVVSLPGIVGEVESGFTGEDDEWEGFECRIEEDEEPVVILVVGVAEKSVAEGFKLVVLFSCSLLDEVASEVNVGYSVSIVAKDEKEDSETRDVVPSDEMRDAVD